MQKIYIIKLSNALIFEYDFIKTPKFWLEIRKWLFKSIKKQQCILGSVVVFQKSNKIVSEKPPWNDIIMPSCKLCVPCCSSCWATSCLAFIIVSSVDVITLCPSWPMMVTLLLLLLLLLLFLLLLFLLTLNQYKFVFKAVFGSFQEETWFIYVAL